jgi:phage shock protein PspC (stress-responsive transcriptional regulator)
MKKIININLSGRVIPIEDSAYEKLQSYIESLRRYFSREVDRDEIINDIESRIAELMNEKIRKGATHITDADIDEIAASMGRPEDFDAEAAEPVDNSSKTSSQQSSYTGSTKAKRRLYRDTSDKFIGGVCSGIAAYLNIDPSIVRILFAIITFGGFGLGFLAYIILWIVLPPRETEGYTGKRLYRNPENRMLGGVAGGLAAYFNRDTWVIRLVFLAPFLFSIFLGIIRGITWRYDFDFVPNIFFGSLGSTFVLTYIVLWIVLPEARSPYEKMEMRGEKVDVNAIRQNMKDRAKEWSEEVKESARNLGNKAKEFADTKGRTFAKEVGETTRRSGSGLGHAIGVLFKVFFLFIAGTIAFGLFVALMALLFSGVVWWPINNFLWTSQWQQLYAWGTLIFFLIVPLVGFFIWLIRRIIRVRSRSSYLGWTFGFLWCVGWVSAILLVVSIAKDFREYESVPGETIQVAQPALGKMTVVVSEPELMYTGNFGWVDDNEVEGWDLTEDSMRLSLVNFEIGKSDDSLYHVAVEKYSFGRTPGDAVRKASNFKYSVHSSDSILDVSSGFTIYKDDKFRGQKVHVIILVPVGKKIRFDETVRRKLNPADFSNSRNRNRSRIVFNSDDYYRWRSNTDYIMQPNGDLKSEHGTIPADYNYRYRKEWKDPADTDTQKTEKNPADTTQTYRYKGVNEELNKEQDEPKVTVHKKLKKQQGKEDRRVARVHTSVLSLTETFF